MISLCSLYSIHMKLIKYQADRLKRLDTRCKNNHKYDSCKAIVGSHEETVRDKQKWLIPSAMKSNNSQEGVLAWVSERLAVSMRQAEDLILRDYIVSAASQINAGGGSNGKIVAVVKSDLIDFKLPLAA